MSFNLTKAAKATRVSNAVAAGTTDVECSSVDMKGFRSVTFVVAFGAITSGAVTSVKAQQSSDNGVADSFADLEGTAISVDDDDDNQIVLLEIDEPLERYVRLVVDRGTQNAVVDGVVALQHNAAIEPVTHDSTTLCDSEYHHAPAEGTA